MGLQYHSYLVSEATGSILKFRGLPLDWQDLGDSSLWSLQHKIMSVIKTGIFKHILRSSDWSFQFRFQSL